MADMPTLRDVLNGTAADATDVEWNFNTIETYTNALNDSVDTAFGAWTSYTPSLTQGSDITKTVTYSKYAKLGRTVIWAFKMTMTEAGAGSSNTTLTLPVTAAATTVNIPFGTGEVWNTGFDYYHGRWRMFGSGGGTLVYFDRQESSSVFLPAFVSGGYIEGLLTYEAAS